MTFLNGHNRRDDGRQCPPDALREALVNAVLHRDYAFPARLWSTSSQAASRSCHWVG